MKEVNMNDGDWMRHIDFEALDEHVEETTKHTRKVSETLTKQGEEYVY